MASPRSSSALIEKLPTPRGRRQVAEPFTAEQITFHLSDSEADLAAAPSLSPKHKRSGSGGSSHSGSSFSFLDEIQVVPTKGGPSDRAKDKRPAASNGAATSLYLLLHRPICRFLCAQIIILWAFASFIFYVYDYSIRPSSVSSGLAQTYGQSFLLQQLGLGTPKQRPVTPSVCKPPGSGGEQKLRKEGLPVVVFLAGVEGSGHKFFEQVLMNIRTVNFSVAQFEPLLHLTADEKQSHVHGSDVRCPLLPYARTLRDYAREMTIRLMASGKGPYLRARDSYPLGRVRTPLARPDLVAMLQLDGLLYDLKVIVLQRSLPDAIRSAVRMGYHGDDVGLQVRIVEDAMVFLDATIRTIPCGKYLVLDFDWIADDPALMAKPLAKFLNLGASGDDIVFAVHQAKRTKPKHNATYPTFGDQTLEEFFALRTDLWPMLASCRGTPYFWPQSHSDWPIPNGRSVLPSQKNGAGLD